MDMRAFAKENRTRCEAADGFNHPLDSWSLSDWMTATMGELGEAANVAKKLNRVRDGIPGNDKPEAELRAQLADEIAYTFIYLDLMAQREGIDLAAAVRMKFERTSVKIGYPCAPTRCGDHVLHTPSGERWVVAWAEGELLAWAGWPNGIAQQADCSVIYRCSDEQHRQAVQEWAGSTDCDGRRARVLRLYGAATEAGDAL
jgi:NTP pyrophosphatase (non-canonical NTP hydrolase)